MDGKINYPSDLEKLFGIDYYDKDECLIFIGSNLSEVFDLGNASSFYLLISREDLLNKDFSNVTCNFEWS